MFFSYDTIEVSVLTALLSLFLEFCFREGNIFEWWLDYWANRWLKKHPEAIKMDLRDATDQDIIELTEGEYETAMEWKHSRVKWWWFKPLGYCVVCMNVWVTGMCLLILPTAWNLNIWECFFTILLSNFLVRFFYKKLI